jgi:hypothetical protein
MSSVHCFHEFCSLLPHYQNNQSKWTGGVAPSGRAPALQVQALVSPKKKKKEKKRKT